ncbi:MAG: WD40/YVTN/BNR-like repeat-containing protein [Candidatus Rokuibacteriota bacterium]
MSVDVLVGTSEGLRELGMVERTHLDGREITAMARHRSGWWAIGDGRTIQRSDAGGSWEEVAVVDRDGATCLAPVAAGVFVGTAGAHLLHLDERRRVTPVEPFETAAGRADWYTPWGDPPDTRSISVAPTGAIYVNVHVGGVLRSADGGQTWTPTLDIEADVHQVLAHPGRAGVILAAAAVGLGISEDGGGSWRFETTGLHATYLRAVAVAGDTILVSASTGPRGRRAALYRRPLGLDRPFERCQPGLPDWFGSNIDTFCLDAAGERVACGTDAGEVFASTDQGRHWRRLAKGLPPVQCLAIA